MGENFILSGTATAVMLGIILILIALFSYFLDLGIRSILFGLGFLFAWLGIWFSKG